MLIKGSAINFFYIVFVFHATSQALADRSTLESNCLTPQNEQGKCMPESSCANTLSAPNALAHRENPKEVVDVCCKTDSPNRHDVVPSTKQLVQPLENDHKSLSDVGLQILLSTQCGADRTGRFSHGERADLAEFPWLALLRYNTETIPFMCGGSLITNRYVLTAAHCLSNEHNLIAVRLGEYDLSAELDCVIRGHKKYCAPEPEEFGIDKAIAHPGYSTLQMTNDVALLKLDRVVTFNMYIRPICLPVTKTAAELNNVTNFLVAGWGITEKGSTSEVRLRGLIPRRERTVCENTWTCTSITENHLCAGGDNSTDTCKGDSGGPLSSYNYYNNTPRHIQYGIASFGCVASESKIAYPVVYANVLHHLPWITANIN